MSDQIKNDSDDTKHATGEGSHPSAGSADHFKIQQITALVEQWRKDVLALEKVMREQPGLIPEESKWLGKVRSLCADEVEALLNVQPSDVADKMREAVQLGARMVNILDLRNAHMEGRIRFYLECAEGKRHDVDLAECIREDLRRLEADRADSYGLNAEVTGSLPDSGQ